jgi:hypothetical protein
MAKSKIIPVENLNAYLFMSIQGKDVQVVYHDTIDNGLAIGAAFVSLLDEDEKLFDILSAAMLTAIENRNKKSNFKRVKFSEKKSNPKQMDGVKSDKTFVKTRKKATK